MSTVILGGALPRTPDRRLDSIWVEDDVRYRICIRCGIHSNQTLKGRCSDCMAVECTHGHLLTKENSYLRKSQSGALAPQCKTCVFERRAAREKAKALAAA